jgi:ABC-type molybdenum transport system ATPase subunit/photorepair protein PhrA
MILGKAGAGKTTFRKIIFSYGYPASQGTTTKKASCFQKYV